MLSKLTQTLKDINCNIIQLINNNDIIIKAIKYNKKTNFKKLISFLNETEILEGQKKKEENAFRAWLLGRMVAKLALATLLNINPKEITIYKSETGKAKCKINSWSVNNIDFSLSHTLNFSVVAAQIVKDKNKKVGIDAELINRPIKKQVQNFIFNEKEKELLLNNNSVFPGPLSFWCAKEAAGKAYNLAYLNNRDNIRVSKANWKNGEITVKILNKNNCEIKIFLKTCSEYLLATTIK